MGIIIGILNQQSCVPTVEPFILPLSLHKGVSVPQALAVTPHIVHNSPRHSTLRIIVIRVHTPEAGGTVVMMQSQFRAHRIDIAVLPDSRGIIRRLAVGQHASVAEWVLTIRIDVLCIHRQRQPVFEFYIDTHIRIRQRKRTETHLCPHMYFFIISEIRLAGRQIHIAGSTELTGGLEDIRFLTVEERNLFHIIQREPSQVHLSVLGITELYSVVIHRGVLAAHRAHIDRLDASYSAVILKLHAGEITQRIGYGQRIKTL